ncbi:putative ABC transporter ATP-binding protein YheS [Clostridium tepidiprofundi DSM 19306]|uniref:Putative ABC transporter ATP-binding protein YheS n=1 Tax=Clostridium tepidiprofundi DSM 19306 TaxID=1121338 RepID=A0A151B3W8_9CLOT|nr:ABC-F family ATP-binding cassette domain-containing protein [Clostridium tepidiprofundi]KYH34611.1 putative ABC transporter ATP-binding protein YheS [Clostridium tepidiprofundi DSM 19306]
MIVLSCKNVKKSYGINVVLNNITFNVNEGDKLGFVGANGAGKSTLFKILKGELDYDSGDIYIDKSKKLGYLSQHLNLQSDNTIYDEMLLVFRNLLELEKKMKLLEAKMNEPYDESNKDYHNKIISDYTKVCDTYEMNGGYTYKAEISRVLKGLGFTENDFDKPINILSGGLKTRAALCKLLLVKPSILLLDEPTNHLDINAIEWLEEYLKAYKGTIIAISHDRYFLDAVTNKTLELINGRIEIYNGNYTKYIDLKKKNFDIQLKAYTLQQKEIKRQEEIIKRFKSFNREKSIRAAESRQKSLDKVERIDAPDKEYKIKSFSFETQIQSGNDVLHIENLSKSFGSNTLFTDVNIDVKRGDRIALIGENGIGKTTLFNIIMDKIPSDNGIKILGKNVFIGYYDQEQSNLNPDKTILDEVWDDFPKMNESSVRSALASFLFLGDDIFKKINSLSGGEKCRINLLKLMLSKSNFLLLDEPTNHLDIMSREALEEALLNYDGTVLVISHDRYFLNKIIGKIFELTRYGMKEYLGNYSYYIDKKKRPHRYEAEEVLEGKTKTQIKLEKKKKRELEKLEKNKKLQVKNLENDIAELEAYIEELHNKLCLEEIYSNPEKSISVNNKISECETKLQKLYNEWEELV